MHESHEQWCAENGERPLSAKALGTELDRRGFDSARERGARVWLGLGLASDLEEPFGILQLREQLDPARSSLAAARRHLAAVKTKLLSGHQQARALAARWLGPARKLWRRLRGRPEHQPVNVGGRPVTLGISPSGRGLVGTPPDWAALSDDANSPTWTDASVSNRTERTV